MDYQHYTPLKIKRRNKSIRPKIFILALFLIGVYFVVHQLNSNPNTNNSLNTTTAKVLSESTVKQPSQLANVVSNSLTGATGTYGVFIKNLKNGETYTKNANIIFDSGSLYKLWIMAVVQYQLETGKLSKNQLLKEKVEVLNEKFQIATESAELTEGTIEFTVTDALNRMITISDNYSALLMSLRVGLANVQSFLEDSGFSQSSVGRDGSNPITTANNIGLFFEKMYNSNLISPTASSKMLTLLKSQRLNHKIPKYLPQNTIIAHKTGELGQFSHDGGIVYTKKGNYIIVILSRSNNPEGAVERIAQISKNVYGYFTK